jgi:hypothetical protein
MERVNRLFEQRNLKESAFSWDGNYANENELEEAIDSEPIGDFETPYEVVEDIDEEVTNITTDIKSSQFFSDEDSKMLTDGPSVG